MMENIKGYEKASKTQKWLKILKNHPLADN